MRCCHSGNCKCCGADKADEEIQRIYAQVAVAKPLASLPLHDGEVKLDMGTGTFSRRNLAAEQSASPPAAADRNSGHLSIHKRTHIRIWGARPYQSDEDNDAEAKNHWRSAARCVDKQDPKRLVHPALAGIDVDSQILESLQSLNPGHGPGLPSTLPVHYENLADRSILKVAAGATFILFLTRCGRVYSVGRGNHGELGQGAELALLRTPEEIVFPEVPSSGAPLDQNSAKDSQEVPSPANATHVPFQRRGSALLRSMDYNQMKEPVNRTQSEGSLVSKEMLREYKLPSTESARDGAIIVDIACGYNHAIAVTREGFLFVWGHHQACGLGTRHDLDTPTLVPAELLMPTEKNINHQELSRYDIPSKPVPFVRTIGAGRQCSAVVTDAGRVLMWGKLPLPHIAVRPELVAITDDLIVAIAFGTSMGLMLNNAGELYQFGTGLYGEILSPILTEQAPQRAMISNMPFRLRALVPEHLPVLEDSSGDLITNVARIAVGDHHAMLLTQNGTVFAYGDNSRGQCGVPEYQQVLRVPTMIPIGSETSTGNVIRHIAVGARHSGAITRDDRLYLWGHSGDYRLIYDTIRSHMDYPLMSLKDNSDRCYSTAPITRLGVAIASGPTIKSSPTLIPNLLAYRVHNLALGDEFTVTVAGDPASFPYDSPRPLEAQEPSPGSQAHIASPAISPTAAGKSMNETDSDWSDSRRLAQMPSRPLSAIVRKHPSMIGASTSSESRGGTLSGRGRVDESIDKPGISNEDPMNPRGLDGVGEVTGESRGSSLSPLTVVAEEETTRPLLWGRSDEGIAARSGSYQSPFLASPEPRR